ncbi:uncharacterized protein KY384_008179 [Bacidia gigantensis]|uniref:uncharacterized protein n=1 Tax=Bacidia gigantensis TaxID=2732470 RepID=UPI001D04E8B3|nr:uncharacterized protein KY384_008179 [Bacidia gigantensis]KAG8526750.1 hypothetical protein KY384_008179 [Bacidia gigantensis]
MAINYLILLSRQGKVRLAKWFTTLSPKEKAKIIKDVSQLVLARRTRMCNFLEYKDTKIVYRRYASLFFIAGCSSTDNELITLEIVHRYVEQMDKYYGNVCELDIIFNFQKAYFILDELLLAGEMQESSKKNVLRCISQQDSLEDMEYLPLKETDAVTSALNFDTSDSRVIGGCDVYTTKAAGSDKKLYKNIENSLESKYASLLSFSAGLPPDEAREAGEALNLSRASPFGPLSQISSRRTFAYLIATLNASHPDYDFSQTLRPSDFRRERSIRKVMNIFDTTLYNLRPRHISVSAFPGRTSAIIPATPPGIEKWEPKMWDQINQAIELSECSVYTYAPEDDPLTDSEDEAALWSFNYFFFNKNKKRVCYLYLRGLSRVGTETPGGSKTPSSIVTVRPKRPASGTWSLPDLEDTSRKRARFWLGDRAENAILVTSDGEDDDEVEFLGAQEKDKPDEEEDLIEHRVFERLSDTASESPCKDRSPEARRTRSSSEKGKNIEKALMEETNLHKASNGE